MKRLSDDAQTMNFLTLHTKDCPKCMSPIEKNGGLRGLSVDITVRLIIVLSLCCHFFVVVIARLSLFCATNDISQSRLSWVRSAGCNHMTCRKCKHEFCWLCGGNYVGHTNCGTWKDGPTSAERQSIEKYMHYSSRFEVHKNSQAFESVLRMDVIEKVLFHGAKKFTDPVRVHVQVGGFNACSHV